jgi:hypothetical protein
MTLLGVGFLPAVTVKIHSIQFLSEKIVLVSPIIVIS